MTFAPYKEDGLIPVIGQGWVFSHFKRFGFLSELYTIEILCLGIVPLTRLSIVLEGVQILPNLHSNHSLEATLRHVKWDVFKHAKILAIPHEDGALVI